MAGAFRLTLDTHAPVLTWGAIGNANAGALLQVAYTVDEPGVDSAVLELQDGRVLNMQVFADRLEVLLPYDAPPRGTITAVAVDALDNLASYTLDVALTGGVGAPPTPLPDRGGAPIPTGPSRRTSERQERRIDSRSRAATSSTTRVAARREHLTRVTASSADRVRRSPARSSSSATTRSTTRVGAAHQLAGATGTTSEYRVVKRDGLELALLLDLL